MAYLGHAAAVSYAHKRAERASRNVPSKSPKKVPSRSSKKVPPSLAVHVSSGMTDQFDTASLKHTETQEENPLPDKDAIQQEEEEQQLISGTENFDPAEATEEVETLEENPLPTEEAIDAEKIAA